APSPTSSRRERGAHRRARLAAIGRSSALELIQTQNSQVAVRNLADRRQVDARPARLVLVDEPVEQRGDLLAVAEAEARLLDSLLAAAAVEVDRGKPTGESLDKRVRIRIVLGRGDEDVVLAQD